MKYELGDFVQIKAKWQKTRKSIDPDDFRKENQRKELAIRSKTSCEEKGFICGHRYGVVQSKTFMKVSENEIKETGFRNIKVYLVATRMNCIYEVSVEDIQLIKDMEELR